MLIRSILFVVFCYWKKRTAISTSKSAFTVITGFKSLCELKVFCTWAYLLSLSLCILCNEHRTVWIKHISNLSLVGLAKTKLANAKCNITPLEFLEGDLKHKALLSNIQTEASIIFSLSVLCLKARKKYQLPTQCSPPAAPFTALSNIAFLTVILFTIISKICNSNAAWTSTPASARAGSEQFLWWMWILVM